MKVPTARAPLRLAAATCPLAFACDCSGPCPLAENPRRSRLVRPTNPAAVGGFLDEIAAGISSAYDTVTSIPTEIAATISPPAAQGDYSNITFAGAKYPTSSVFTPEFVAIRTLNSLQSLANDIASGLALPRDDGSIATRDNRSTLAPAGSAYASFFQAKGVQVLASSAAPVISQPASPGVLDTILSTVSFGILGGQDSSSPVVQTGPSPATAGVKPTTGPAWVDQSFLAVSTQPRLDRIVADLKTGAAVVLTDGSVGVPLAGGTYSIIAPAGSVNVPLYSMQTGQATVAPKGGGAAGQPVPVATTLDGLLKNVGQILTMGATTAAQVYAQQAVAQVTPQLVTPATQAATAQVSVLSSQLAQAQAALAAQKTAADQQAVQAQILQLQAQLAQARADGQAAAAAAAVATPLMATGLVAGPVATPAYIAPASSISTPDLSSALAAMLSATPAAPTAPAAAVTTPIAAGPTGGLNWTLIILGVALVGGGGFFLWRRSRGAGSSRAYHTRRIRRRRRHAYA